MSSIVSELEDRAPDHGFLASTLGLVGYLSCLTVIERARAAGRMIVARGLAGAVCDRLRALGIAAAIAPFEIATGGAGPASLHDGSFVPAGSRPDASSIVYFGEEDLDCATAEWLDRTEDHVQLGALFGYPSCCVDAFVEARRTLGGEDQTARGIPDAGPFPRQLNPLLRHCYGFRCVFHFPCSPRCDASLELARAVVESLAARSPAALGLAKLGAGIGLYGPRVGAVLITEHDPVSDGSVRARAAIARAIEGSPFQPGCPAPEVAIHSQHRFSVGGVAFDDGAHFVARFA